MADGQNQEDNARRAVEDYKSCLIMQVKMEDECRKLRQCAGLDPGRARKALEDACDPCFQNRDADGAVIQDEFPPE